MTLCHVIDDCEPIEMDCRACRGEGRRGDAYCIICSGDGCEFFSRSELYMLAHNLGIAAALCRAWTLGTTLWPESVYPRCHGLWKPGCGRSAP